MEYICRVNNLYKAYGANPALRGISMSIPKGAIYGLIGRNGAGKTTLFRLLCALQYPDSGGFELFGTENTEKSIADKRRRIGAMVDFPSLYNNMSAEENIRQCCRIRGVSYPDKGGELLRLVGLENTGSKRAGDFSKGMRQRLGIAVALVGEPDLLLLDEPGSGLDPQGLLSLRQLIFKLNRERNITFLISSHMLDELAKVATHYGFIDHGCLLKEMSAAELAQVCRKSMRLEVSDTQKLKDVLEGMNAQFEIIDAVKADVFTKLSLTKLAIELDKENCELYSCYERDEDLEAYFLALIGGGKDE